ncbi:MAG: biopolymer transporter ExbD [Pirellulaceae bacterium]|nr:biopolymer transporter ExbD [Pirellulaceae bacterium]
MTDGLIHFLCPVCQARLASATADEERSIECPECNSELTVPFESQRRGADQDLYADEAAIGFRKTNDDRDAELDMTPMVDVTFLLLIFFMVTAAFTMQKSFKVPTPDEDAPSSQYRETEDEDGVITVRIDEYNTFHVSAPNWDEEQEAPSEQELLRKLREAKDGDGGGIPPNTLIVVAHGEATHGKVVMAMDAGTEIGMEEVKLRTVDDDA